MNPCKPLIIFSILIIALSLACSEKDEFAPYLKGDIIGYAFCYDEYGNDLEDYSGIKVVTEPGRKYSAVTDKNGRYVLKHVLNGTYNLSFEKEGFGTMKMFGIQHLGGGPTIISYHYSDDYVVIFQNITTEITAIHYQNDSLIADLAFSGEYKAGTVYMRLLFSQQRTLTFNLPKHQKVLNYGIEESISDLIMVTFQKVFRFLPEKQCTVKQPSIQIFDYYCLICPGLANIMTLKPALSYTLT